MTVRNFFRTFAIIAIVALFGLTLFSPAFALKAKESGPQIINPPVTDASGGPDGFGYVWRDNNNEPTGPVYNWRDISVTGTDAGISGDDMTSAAFPIGFTFNFYGTAYTQFKVCTNGWITLDVSTTATSYFNEAIPSTTAPNALIAPYWDDLNITTGTHWVKYQTINSDTLVVSWYAVQLGQTSNFGFQAILTSSGHIYFQYQSIPTTNNSASIGIENATGTVGLQVAFNSVYAAASRAVRFNLSDPQNFGTLTGTVTAAGSPLPGANVLVVGTTRSAITNAQGQYTIINIDPGTYTVRFTAFGYTDTDYTGVIITAGQITTRNHSWATAGLNFNSPSVPVAIVDNDTAFAYITIANGFLVADLNVMIDITHTWDSDLSIWVTSPGGVNVMLAALLGGSGDNYTQTLFDDEATTPIASGVAPFTGSFIPAQPLSGFDGTNSAGVWTLNVFDGAGGDIGTINQFSLAFSSGAGSYIRGTVTRAGQPVDSARVQVGTNVTYTNSQGIYGMASLTGQFAVNVTRSGYNPFSGNVTIGTDTTTYNVTMTRPIAIASPTSIEMQVNVPNTGNATVTLTNNGDGPLSWNGGIRPVASAAPVTPSEPVTEDVLRLISDFDISIPRTSVPATDEPDTLWQRLLNLAVDPLNGSAYNYGVEVVNGQIYVTAGTKFYRFTAQGALIDSLTIGGAPVANFNVRDMAYDGDYLYGGWDASLLRAFNPATGASVPAANINLAPAGLSLPRGVAYDPESDNFYVSNWTANNMIKKINRSGAVLATWNVPGVGGLAWDPNGQNGYKLYLALDGANAAHVAKLNVNNTAALDTLTLRSPLPGVTTEICGGLTLTDQLVPGFWTLVVLVQGSPDRVFVYEFGIANTRWSLNPTSGVIAGSQNGQMTVSYTPQAGDPNAVVNADLMITWGPTDDVITIPIEVTVVTSVSSNEAGVPLKYELLGAYPNPFNPETKVKFSLANRANVTLALYNVNGQKVGDLLNAEMPAGIHTVGMRAVDLPAGTYFVRMQADGYVGTSKVVLLK